MAEEEEEEEEVAVVAVEEVRISPLKLNNVQLPSQTKARKQKRRYMYI